MIEVFKWRMPAVPRRQALGAAFSAVTLAACGGGGSSLSSNAALAGLSLSVAGLQPAFDSATTSYTLAVANSVSSLTATPTTADGAASVRVNGASVASGATSAAVALAVGSNTLSIVVTAADGSSTRTYSVLVTRAAASAVTAVSEEEACFMRLPPRRSGTRRWHACARQAGAAVSSRARRSPAGNRC